MRIVEVGNFVQALKMSRMRNECRMFMTRSQALISVGHQLDWYWREFKSMKKAGRVNAWLVTTNGRNGKVVGWGYIVVDDDGRRAWVTGGLLEKYRGYGYGKILFRHLTNTARIMGCEPWLEVFAWNDAGLGTYMRLGYEIVGKVGRGASEVITMRSPVYG